MVHKNGFTLIELLIVLGVFSTLLLISVPIGFATIEKHQANKFLETFEFDLLYIQSLATITKERVRIRFTSAHQYKIIRGEKNSTLHVRDIPKNIKINTRSRQVISFDENGRIREPQKGRIEIKVKQSIYHVIFPLGKGRCSIVKQ